MEMKAKLRVDHVLSLAFPGFRYTFNAISTHANDHLSLVLPHKKKITLFTLEASIKGNPEKTKTKYGTRCSPLKGSPLISQTSSQCRVRQTLVLLIY